MGTRARASEQEKRRDAGYVVVRERVSKVGLEFWDGTILVWSRVERKVGWLVVLVC